MIKSYKVPLTALVVILALLALVHGVSVRNNFLGYKSVCPSAPIATALTLAVAAVVWWLGSKQ